MIAPDCPFDIRRAVHHLIEVLVGLEWNRTWDVCKYARVHLLEVFVNSCVCVCVCVCVCTVFVHIVVVPVMGLQEHFLL